MADVAIIGAGSWGIALAKVLHTNGNKSDSVVDRGR